MQHSKFNIAYTSHTPFETFYWCVYISGLQPFLFNRPLRRTLLENHPPLMILVLSKILFYFEQGSDAVLKVLKKC